MEPIGIIVILLISIFGLTAYVLYLRQKESKTMQDSNALKIKESELRDVAIILQDGTLYESYQGVLLTHFSDRIYHLHAMNGSKKELVARLHLGDGMMLKVMPRCT
jgi:hypothetical protein